MLSTASLEPASAWRGKAFARCMACLMAAASVFFLAVWTPLGQRLDSDLMGVGFAPLPRPMELLQWLRKGSLFVLAALVITAAVVALARRRWGLVARCAVLVAGSVAVVSWLRRVLTRPELGDPTYPFNTWPSGHVAASTSLVVAAFVLSPPRLQTRFARRVAAVTVAVVAAASIATLAHRPSDVVASILWVAALSAVLFPIGPLGWRALSRDRWLALASVAVAMTCTLVPGLVELGLLANGAWVCAAAFVTVGWNGSGSVEAHSKRSRVGRRIPVRGTGGV